MSLASGKLLLHYFGDGVPQLGRWCQGKVCCRREERLSVSCKYSRRRARHYCRVWDSSPTYVCSPGWDVHALLHSLLQCAYILMTSRYWLKEKAVRHEKHGLQWWCVNQTSFQFVMYLINSRYVRAPESSLPYKYVLDSSWGYSSRCTNMRGNKAVTT